jgi:hypothetical protein
MNNHWYFWFSLLSDSGRWHHLQSCQDCSRCFFSIEENKSRHKTIQRFQIRDILWLRNNSSLRSYIVDHVVRFSHFVFVHAEWFWFVTLHHLCFSGEVILILMYTYSLRCVSCFSWDLIKFDRFISVLFRQSSLFGFSLHIKR